MKTITAFVAALLIAMPCQAYALNINQIDFNFDSQMVTIKGSDASGNAGKVCIEVLNPDVTVMNEPPYITGSIEASVCYIDQKSANQDGTFSFSFFNDRVSGEYKVRIHQSKTTGIVEKTFDYVNRREAEEQLALINQKDNIQEGVDFYGRLLNTNLMNSVSNKGFIYEYIKSNRPYEIGNITNEIKKAATVAALNEASNGSQVKVILEDYKSDSGILETTAIPDMYQKINDRSGFYERLLTVNRSLYSDYDQVMGMFEAAVILESVEKAETWKQIADIIARCKSIIGIDGECWSRYQNKYIANSSEYVVINSMLDKSYTSLKYLKEDFEVSVNTDNGKSEPQKSTTTGGDKKKNNYSFNSDAVINNILPVFTDIGSAVWAKESIEILAHKGILNGYENGMFKPDNRISRKEFVKMLISAFGLQDQTAQSNFNDVSQTDWSYVYVSSAYRKGIIKGMSQESFEGDQSVTRQDMAVMVCRAADYAGVKFQPSALDFSDSQDIDDYAKTSVGMMRGAGVMMGDEEHRFLPAHDTTRAQAAKVLWETLKIAEKDKLN